MFMDFVIALVANSAGEQMSADNTRYLLVQSASAAIREDKIRGGKSGPLADMVECDGE